MSIKYVLCNAEMLALVPPIEVSEPIPHYDYSVEFVALYELSELPADEKPYEDAGAWYRECGRANTPIPYYPEEIANGGLWPYIQTFGASTERNRAACLGELASNANAGDLIAFVNSLTPEKSQGQQLER